MLNVPIGYESMMWKTAHLSVRGSAHHINGLPCQDDCEVVPDDPLEGPVIAALSDGAGSAPYSDIGARFVVNTTLEFACEALLHQGAIDAASLVTVLQSGLAALAQTQNASPHDYAATLLLAVVHPEKTFLLQIGDGCWIASRGGIWGCLTWPEQGEFVGQTTFVTSKNAADATQIIRLYHPVDHLIGMTDGLERLALDMQGQRPHPGFFAPLVNALASSTDPWIFTEQLQAFLESDRVCDRTDDDKTLVIISQQQHGHSL